METNNTKTVLVVDDDPSLLWVLGENIKKSGFDVIQAGDGNQALNIAMEKHPDLILVDIMMPQKSGLEFLQKLRQDEWGKTVPVFVLTSFDADVEAEARQYGIDEYLIKKDWLPEQITEKIKMRLGI